jgi:Restriction Enzyme Adenine Methylase Associated
VLNRSFRKASSWDDECIRIRTDQLIDLIVQVWPVPEGRMSGTERTERRPTRRIDVADLIAAGLIDEGATLHARRRRFADQTATVLLDGSLDMGGVRYATPSAASGALAGATDGWGFWLIDPTTKRSLDDIRNDYIDERDVDVEDDQEPDQDDDE